MAIKAHDYSLPVIGTAACYHFLIVWALAVTDILLRPPEKIFLQWLDDAGIVGLYSV